MRNTDRMRSYDFYWCSDPAVGSAADIAAAIAAWLAAIGAVAGIAFAYKRYRDSLDDKRREQARFVHSYFDEFVIVEAQGTLNAIHRARVLNLPQNVTARPYVVTETGNGLEYSRALQRVVFCRVTVENRSEEIVTNVYGQVDVWQATQTGRRTDSIGAWEGFPYLLPQSKETFWVAVPYTGPEDAVRDVVDPMLFFTDANGHGWSRSPFGPPERWDPGDRGVGAALPLPDSESDELDEPREWSAEELAEAVSDFSGVEANDLMLLGREGRGATLLSDDTLFAVNFALHSDNPLIIAQHMGNEAIEYMRREAENSDN